MPVTITIVSPDVDEAPGSAGAFPSDYTTAINTAIVVEITGAVFEVVTAQFPDSSKPSGFSDEVCVYRDGDFRQGFAERSIEAAITDGKRLTILPDGHWPGTTALHDVRLNIDGVEGGVTPPPYTIDSVNSKPTPKTLGEMSAFLAEVGVTSGDPTHAYLFGDAAIRPWRIKKVSGTNGVFNAGAASTTSFAGDGYVEFQAAADVTLGRLVGLSDVDTNQDYNTIDYALYLNEGGGQQVYKSENGTLTLLSTYVEGDVFQVKRVGTAISYWKNGVQIGTSATPSSGALIVDSSFYNTNALIQGVKLFDNGVQVAIAWGATTNCAVWQEAEDIIGSKNLPATSAPTAWQQARAGWGNTFLRLTKGVAGMLENTTFPNVNANPYLLLGRVAVDDGVSAGQPKTVVRVGDFFDDDATFETNAAGNKSQLGNGSGSTRKVGTANPVGAGVLSFALLIDPGTWRACVLYTSQERISAPTGGLSANGGSITVGGDFAQTWNPPTMDILDLWVFEGSAARKTVAEIRAIFDGLDLAAPPAMGWNVMKTGGSTSYDSGAFSIQAFAGDCSVEFEIGAGGTGEFAIGLSDTDTNADYTSIDFGVLHDNGTTYRIEAGALTALGVTAVSGDKFKVTREGANMKIYYNGALQHTFGTTTAAALHVDISIRIQNTTIHQINAVDGATPVTLSWSNAINVATY